VRACALAAKGLWAQCALTARLWAQVSLRMQTVSDSEDDAWRWHFPLAEQRGQWLCAGKR
jgi:hypothetical protein